MKIAQYFKEKWLGLSVSARRYPVSTFFLVVIAVLIGIEIHGTTVQLGPYINTGVVLAIASAAAQHAYERFFANRGLQMRLGLAGIALIIGGLHFLTIFQLPEYSMEAISRTGILSVALAVLFIWLPVIQHRYSFEQSLMSNFKNFFQALLYGGVIMLGVAAIITAIDQLLFNLSYRFYSYSADLIFVLFTPIFFLSLAPFFPQESLETSDEKETQVQQKISSPKVLDILLSYIVIPLTMVFTVILLAYVVLNLRGEFWTDNLLEPMLVSYSATVIFVTLLTMHIENSFTQLFRKWAPKILIPIVLFQLVASVLTIQQNPMTHQRYFVILYGVFAILAGIALSIARWQRKGIVAGLLVFFLVLSITPPIDAFTISRNSHINHLESTLMKYDMIQNDEVVITTPVSQEDRQKITESLFYLERLGRLDQLSWLPEGFQVYYDWYFEKTFGFPLYEYQEPDTVRMYVFLTQDLELFTEDYQYLTRVIFSEGNKEGSMFQREFVIQEEQYRLGQTMVNGLQNIELRDSSGTVILEFKLMELYERLRERTGEKGEINLEEATFVVENTFAKMKIIIESVDVFEANGNIVVSGPMLLMISIP